MRQRFAKTGGVAARDALRQRLSGQTVTVHEHRRDTYGRPLVDVALGDEDMAAWMVRQGWAWSYRWRKILARLHRKKLWRDRGNGAYSENAGGRRAPRLSPPPRTLPRG